MCNVQACIITYHDTFGQVNAATLLLINYKLLVRSRQMKTVTRYDLITISQFVRFVNS